MSNSLLDINQTRLLVDEYLKDNPPATLKYIGRFENKDDIYKNAEKLIGNIANTTYAMYLFDGNDWLIIDIIQNIIPFKVLDSGYITGRGYYVVIENPDELPITTSSNILINNRTNWVSIRGVEKMMKLMSPPYPDSKWGLITNKEIPIPKSKQIEVELNFK